MSSLMVLYGIHPEDLQTRVERKVTQIQSKLHKMGAEAELVSVQDGVVYLWVKVEGQWLRIDQAERAVDDRGSHVRGRTGPYFVDRGRLGGADRLRIRRG